MSDLEHGLVTSVNYRRGVPVCSVQLIRVNSEDDEVLVSRMHHGMFCVPKVDQKVLMLKLGNQRFIIGVLDHGAEYEDPELEEGDVAFQFDDDTKLSFIEDDGVINVNVEASGEVNVVGESVKINGTDFETHTHDYEDDDGSSTTTKTTDEPNPPE